jgi:hypothetical protein
MCSNGIQLTKAWIPIQPIHILVDYFSSAFDIKIIFLNNESLFCQFPQTLWAFLMVGDQNVTIVQITMNKTFPLIWILLTSIWLKDQLP